MSDIFDFGFTAVDENELDSVQLQKNAATSIEERLDSLYNAIIPLLTNLKKNPEKEYILWPNRLNKVEEFETMITRIYNGA
jgi:flagellin-specific chaperone FliS